MHTEGRGDGPLLSETRPNLFPRLLDAFFYHHRLDTIVVT